ncbi:hypothetical protein BV898_11639 [Hypsibius exemplaris]|uniref:Uncharacterized protein n=1 Tax=Hypsibius exemplaris TaxID=2072580 RepID=A0A1W0WG47_HYPEX|nr:hypothetical protein BV898_11639 [Hypsibius exemplaris]
MSETAVWFRKQCRFFSWFFLVATTRHENAVFGGSFGKIDCGPFFCPVDRDSQGSELPSSGPEDLQPAEEADPGERNYNPNNTYCCFTVVPPNQMGITMPFCCNWEEYEENTYNYTGFSATSRVMMAFLPVGLALVVTIVAVLVIVQFICCRLERPSTNHHAPRERGLSTV